MTRICAVENFSHLNHLYFDWVRCTLVQCHCVRPLYQLFFCDNHDNHPTWFSVRGKWTGLANISGKRRFSWFTVCLSVWLYFCMSRNHLKIFTHMDFSFGASLLSDSCGDLIFHTTQDIPKTPVTYQPSHTFLSQNHYGESPHRLS